MKIRFFHIFITLIEHYGVLELIRKGKYICLFGLGGAVYGCQLKQSDQ